MVRRSFNSRPSCDGRPGRLLRCNTSKRFQFTPVLRRATFMPCAPFSASKFQFTPVLRRATVQNAKRRPTKKVSIHARLATGDTIPSSTSPSPSFNSRPSCDGRLPFVLWFKPLSCFNSRPSCDGRPLERGHARDEPVVSIHARLATGDACRQTAVVRVGGFNSRPSCDGRLGGLVYGHRHRRFQFTPVLRRATWEQLLECVDIRCFNSRPSCDGRHANNNEAEDRRCFNSRPSCDGRPR